MESTQQKYGQAEFEEAVAVVIAAGPDAEGNDGAFETPGDFLEHLGVDVDAYAEGLQALAEETLGGPEEYGPFAAPIASAYSLGLMLGLVLSEQQDNG